MLFPQVFNKNKAIAATAEDGSSTTSAPPALPKKVKPVKKRRIKISNIKMHSLNFTNGPDAGQKFSDLCHYSQSVIVGNTCKVAGQGGWDRKGHLEADNIMLQVDLAFDNIDIVLRAAGLKGWEDVYHVRSYHTDLSVSFDLMVRKLKERIPGHRPVWTAVGVKELAFPAMKIEIEVEALVGQDGL